MTNPLQQHFRQSKLFVSLPSKGIYNKAGAIQGDPEKIAVFGMTGSDEILMKTPDTLLTGESTVKVFESCCPAIKDGWDICSLDTDVLLAAIRIATNGNTVTVTKTCDDEECGALNDYDIDLSDIIDHFANCKYESKIVIDSLIIKIQPLTYKQTSEYSTKNFRIQKQMQQVMLLEDEEVKNEHFAKLFTELSQIQLDIFTDSVESVDIGTTVVTEKRYINEWLQNCDKMIFDEIKKQFNKNKEDWKVPPVAVMCNHCGHKSELAVELDQSIFFGNA